MRKLLPVALAALALSCAPAAHAANPGPFSRAHRFSAQDMSAFADARIAALKAGLRLTAEQEKNWPTLETALKEIAQTRIARMEEMREKGVAGLESDPLGVLRRRAEAMSGRAAALEKLATAAQPLYATLDDDQKRRFGALLRTALSERMGRGGWRGRRGGGFLDGRDQ